MAVIITESCILCGVCVGDCPQGAISEGQEIYVVDPALCTECLGHDDEMACAAVCPMGSCIVDKSNPETREELLAKKIAS